MTPDSTKSLTPTPSLTESSKKQMTELLESGLADFSLRDLLGALLSDVGEAERKTYLQNAQDKANGFYPRTVQVGSVPVDVDVPRTRTGKFRPASLPAPYQRGYADESQTLLLNLLASQPFGQCGPRRVTENGTVRL